MGFPHSETPGSKPMCGSPGLIAAYRVLLRLVMPRHPSCARIRLAGTWNGSDTNLALLRCNLFSSQTMQLSKNKSRLSGKNRRDAFSFQVSRPVQPLGDGGRAWNRTGDLVLIRDAL